MSSKYLDDERQARLAEHEYDFNDRLDGHRVLVAGGSGGLGAAISSRLMHEGASLLVAYRSGEERARRLKHALEGRYGGSVDLLEADIATDEGREHVAAAVDSDDFYGAAICVGDPARIAPDDLDLANLERALRINYSGPILLARACAEVLSKRATPGAIVLLSSMQGVAPFPGTLAYSGPKSALVHASRILAQEYAGAAQLRINVVAPGVTETGMALASIASGKYDPYVDNGLIPRFGRPEDVARAVGFLMVPDNYVTGQILLVDGGLTLCRGVR